MARNARRRELKIVRIGNSRGVRLPRSIIEKYALRETLVLEERDEGLLLRSGTDKRLSWEDTFKEMAREQEDWSAFDGTLLDGLTPGDEW